MTTLAFRLQAGERLLEQAAALRVICSEQLPDGVVVILPNSSRHFYSGGVFHSLCERVPMREPRCETCGFPFWYFADDFHAHPGRTGELFFHNTCPEAFLQDDYDSETGRRVYRLVVPD